WLVENQRAGVDESVASVGCGGVAAVARDGNRARAAHLQRAAADLYQMIGESGIAAAGAVNHAVDGQTAAGVHADADETRRRIGAAQVHIAGPRARRIADGPQLARAEHVV